jgi:hypothetical protein
VCLGSAHAAGLKSRFPKGLSKIGERSKLKEAKNCSLVQASLLKGNQVYLVPSAASLPFSRSPPGNPNQSRRIHGRPSTGEGEHER